MKREIRLRVNSASSFFVLKEGEGLLMHFHTPKAKSVFIQWASMKDFHRYDKDQVQKVFHETVKLLESV